MLLRLRIRSSGTWWKSTRRSRTWWWWRSEPIWEALSIAQMAYVPRLRAPRVDPPASYDARAGHRRLRPCRGGPTAHRARQRARKTAHRGGAVHLFGRHTALRRESHAHGAYVAAARLERGRKRRGQGVRQPGASLPAARDPRGELHTSLFGAHLKPFRVESPHFSHVF